MDTIHTGFEDLGLALYSEFLSPDEERGLISKINDTPAHKIHDAKHRTSIARFGSSRPYSSYIKSKVIPDYLLTYAERLVALSLVPALPDSVSINEYAKGHTIEPHIDSRASGDVITVLSLESPAVMKFTLAGHEPFTVDLPARSLVQIRDKIRLIWYHEILPVPGHRYSIVFRRSTMH